VKFLGLQFPNAVGLAAGFDKNAVWLRELDALGFGHVEIGTVTPRPQPGNHKPRLFRLPQDRALINRMGFNNDGVAVIAKRLQAWRAAGSKASRRLIVGGNIGKNKVTPNEEAWKDYEICFQALYPWVDYFVVNVSSPNTPGLRALQEKESLRKILTHLQQLREQRIATDGRKPLLLKIAPDLTNEQLDDVVSLALEIGLDGLVASNTTISREGLKTDAEKVKAMGAGGLSGAPVRERSTAIVRYLHQATQGRVPVIASGGIFTVADAAEKIKAGASLVQVWTGFIYVGPAIVKKICRSGLLK
jgi:dihydroorotate dehydrogenase